MKRLIVSGNPWSFCVAVERMHANRFRDERPDFLNLFDLCSQWSPDWSRTDRIIERLDRKIPRFVASAISGEDIGPTIDIDWDAVPPPPATMEALAAARIGAARVGAATLSTIVTLTTIHPARDPAEFGDDLGAAWKVAHVSAQIGRQLAERGYDEIYLFNGRHCYSRPLCDVVAEAGTRIWRYEQGATGSSYLLSDQGVHLTEARAALVRATPFDEAAAERFFASRIAKSAKDVEAWSATFFTAGQSTGRLPEGMDDKPVLSFFTSSADEYLFISDDPQIGAFANQMEAVTAVAHEANRQGAVLVLRLHPHLKYKHESWRREWDFDALEQLGVVIVHAEDEVDTYALVNRSRCVFTCGSTVGIEAVFLGVPCVAFGSGLGNELGATIEISSLPDIARAIADPRIAPGARAAALHYASFVASAGAPLRSIDYGSHPDFARVDGRIVDPIRYAARKIRNVFNRHPMSASRDGKLVMDPGLQRRIIALGEKR